MRFEDKNNTPTQEIDIEYLKDRFSFLENITNIAKIYLDEKVNNPINKVKKEYKIKKYSLISLLGLIVLSGILSFTSLFFILLVLIFIPIKYLINRKVKNESDDIYVNIFVYSIKSETLCIESKADDVISHLSHYKFTKNKDEYEVLTEIMDYIDNLNLNELRPLSHIRDNKYDKVGLHKIRFELNDNNENIERTNNSKAFDKLFNSSYLSSVRNNNYETSSMEIISSSAQIPSIPFSSDDFFIPVRPEPESLERKLLNDAFKELEKHRSLMVEYNHKMLLE